MRKTAKHIILLVFFLFAAIFLYADEGWQGAFFLSQNNIVALAFLNNDLYFATDSKIYRMNLENRAQTVIFTSRGGSRIINNIAIFKNLLFICTSDGIYRYNPYDGKLFTFLKGNFPNVNDFFSISYDSIKDVICITTDKGVYMVQDGSVSTKKIYDYTDEDESDAEETADEDEEPSLVLRGAIVDAKSEIYIYTNKGIWHYDDERIWRKMFLNGAISDDVNHMAATADDSFIIATQKGVYLKHRDDNMWFPLLAGLKDSRIKYVFYNKRDPDWIYCLTKKSTVYKYFIGEVPKVESRRFAMLNADKEYHCPSINRIQQLAIEYAEVSPEKIQNWRRKTKFRGILPKLTFGLDCGIDSNVNLDRGGTNDPDLFIIGPENQDLGWDLTLSWDLSDLIFNEFQTSIDVRSKLMVQLREELLDEVTRIYFERKRLMIDSGNLEGEKLVLNNLRVQELNAYLDAYTGGAFSRLLACRDTKKQ